MVAEIKYVNDIKGNESMTAETYEKITVPFRKHPKSSETNRVINKILTYITYCAYSDSGSVLFDL